MDYLLFTLQINTTVYDQGISDSPWYDLGVKDSPWYVKCIFCTGDMSRFHTRIDKSHYIVFLDVLPGFTPSMKPWQNISNKPINLFGPWEKPVTFEPLTISWFE